MVCKKVIHKNRLKLSRNLISSDRHTPENHLLGTTATRPSVQIHSTLQTHTFACRVADFVDGDLYVYGISDRLGNVDLFLLHREIELVIEVHTVLIIIFLFHPL